VAGERLADPQDEAGLSFEPGEKRRGR